MVRHGSHEWFYSLVKNESKSGLLDRYGRFELQTQFTVCATKIDGGRLFGTFDSFIDYIIFVKPIDPKHRCYYEVLFGEFACKPHFDIDISRNETIDLEYAETCIINIIDAIILCFKQLFQTEINLNKDIRIYTSHGATKFSYHIIINNYCHSNAIQSKAFFHKVIEKVDDRYKKYMDDSVYSSTQQFRLLGSRKLNSDRVKIFQDKWKYQSKTIQCEYSEQIETPEHLEVVQMKESLVGYTLSCVCLPDLIDQLQKKTVLEVDDKTVDKALKLCSENFKFDWDNPNAPFMFRYVKDGYICLTRLKPSHCNVCSVVHENEHPYLLVLDNCVYFSCRREKMHREFLGYIEEEKTYVEEEVAKPIDIFNTFDVYSRLSNSTVTGKKKQVKHTDEVDQKTLDKIQELLAKSHFDSMVKKSWSSQAKLPIYPSNF